MAGGEGGCLGGSGETRSCVSCLTGKQIKNVLLTAFKKRKLPVGWHFKSKATRCAGFGTNTPEFPTSRTQPKKDVAGANLAICVITLKPHTNISVYFYY